MTGSPRADEYLQSSRVLPATVTLGVSLRNHGLHPARKEPQWDC